MKQNVSMLMIVQAYVHLLNPSRSMKLWKGFAERGDWSLTAMELTK